MYSCIPNGLCPQGKTQCCLNVLLAYRVSHNLVCTSFSSFLSSHRLPPRTRSTQPYWTIRSSQNPPCSHPYLCVLAHAVSCVWDALTPKHLGNSSASFKSELKHHVLHEGLHHSSPRWQATASYAYVSVELMNCLLFIFSGFLEGEGYLLFFCP